MAPASHIPLQDFEHRLADLDTDAFAAFVGRLWAETAESVTVDPPVVTVESELSSRRLVVTTRTDPTGTDLADGETLVTTTADAVPESTVEAIGPGALRDRLLYALSPEQANSVCETFLDVPARAERWHPADAEPIEDPQGGRDASASPPEKPSPATGQHDLTTDEAASPHTARPAARFAGLPGPASQRTTLGIALVALLLAVGGAAAVFGPGLAGQESQPAGDSDRIDGGTSAPESQLPGAEAGFSDAEGTPADPNPDTFVSPAATVATITADAGHITSRYARLEPTCDRSFLHVVQIQMKALRYNNNESNDGIRAVRRFASPENREAIPSFDRFLRIVYSKNYAPMLTYDSVEYEPNRVSATDAEVRVTTRARGEVSGRYSFHLTKQTEGELEGCWLTDGVHSVGASRNLRLAPHGSRWSPLG